MAYSLRGCNVVLKSDIEKRDRALAKVGRTANNPVVSSLFIHSRASYSLGSYIGANPKSFEPVSDPYIATFMEPQRKGNNLRMHFIKSTQDKAGREAFDADAGYGLNFTVASNWKKAAMQNIFGRNTKMDDDALGGGRDLQDFEVDENEAIVASRNSAPTVVRGKTSGERRQMCFAADGNMMCKSYAEMDPRAFFSKRGQTVSTPGMKNYSSDTQISRGIHTLRTMDPLSEHSPFRRGTLRSRPSSAKSRISQTSRTSRREYDALRDGPDNGGTISSARGETRDGNRWTRQWSAGSQSARDRRPTSRGGERPSSKGGRPNSSSTRSGGVMGVGVGESAHHWEGSAGENGRLEIVARELDMPTVSFEEDPAAWYRFAQNCFLNGQGDLARRALRALEGDETLLPAAGEAGGMSMRSVFQPSNKRPNSDVRMPT